VVPDGALPAGRQVKYKAHGPLHFGSDRPPERRPNPRSCISISGEHVGHYTGWAEDLDRRLAEHLGGRAARLIEVITQAGIGFRLAAPGPG
jgi:hypothetical protein